MKKIKFFKQVLFTSPLLISSLLVTACANDNGASVQQIKKAITILPNNTKLVKVRLIKHH